MDHKVPDLPSGPLDIYRKKASFNWKDMLNFIDDEEAQAYKVDLCTFTLGSYTSALCPPGSTVQFGTVRHAIICIFMRAGDCQRPHDMMIS